MSRLRVLRIIARMNVGGPAMQVTTLTNGLDRDRYEQRLLVGTVADDEQDYVALRAPGLPVEVIPGLGRAPQPLDDLRALREARRIMHDFRPHIVHTHTAKAGVVGRLAAQGLGVPALVHTFHGHLLHGYFSPTLTRAVIATERALAWRTDRIVAVGTRVRDDLLGAGIGRPAQYVVVAPGTHLPEVPDRDLARKELGLPLDAPVIAFVGRLTAIKRPDRLIAAATQIAQRNPAMHLAIVGEGDLYASTREQAAPLGDRVRFLGWRGDVETVYAAADVVLLTSDNEGMPVSLIEASLAGRACVTTAVGSAAEVVVDGLTGLVTEREPAALAAAVCALLDDPERRERMGSAAAQHAAERFGAARLVGDTEQLYEELAREKGFD